MTPSSQKSEHRAVDLSGLSWINVDLARDRPDFEQRHMLLLFWSPSSVPCLQALTVLADLLPRYDGRLLFVAVHSPRYPRERELDSARGAVARLGIRHPVVHDAEARLREYHKVEKLPTMVLIGPDGQSIRLPGEPDSRRLRDLLDRLLAQAANTSATGPVRVLTSGATAVPGEPLEAPGRLRFPSTIKAMQGAAAHQRWAVADSGHHQIVLMDDYGRERIRFGSGEPGLADGGRDEARFRSPQGLICSTDAVFVADTGNHCIRRIDINDHRVTTLAGTGQRGRALPHEEHAGLSTALASPWDLELDGGYLYFSNAGTHQIGVYDCVDRTVKLLAGSGRHGTADGSANKAELAQPSGLVIEDSGDRLFFTDSDSGLVRSLSLDERALVATHYGPGSGRTSFRGRLQYPLGLAWAEGELLVADSYNDRLVTFTLDTTGIVEQGGEPWSALVPALSEPSGIWAEDLQRLLIVDRNNHRIVHYLAGQEQCQLWPVPA